jgi:hypothetical protein
MMMAVDDICTHVTLVIHKKGAKFWGEINSSIFAL